MKRKLLVILSSILVSLVGPTLKSIPGETHPLVINFLRILFGFIFLTIFMPFIDKKTFIFKSKDVKGYALLGFLTAVSFSLYLTALSLAPVSNVVLISESGAIFVAIFSYFILKEKLAKKQAISITLAFIGLVIINPLDSSVDGLGNLLALSQAIVYGILLTYIRKEEKTHTLGVVTWVFFFASLFLIPFIFIYGIGNFVVIWPYLLFLGIVCTATPYTLITYSTQKMHADEVAILTLITIPLSSITLAYFILGEIPTLKIIIGGLFLISGGILLHIIRKGKEKQIKKQLHIFRSQ